MIPDETRQAILLLKGQGRGVRDIGRCLQISRNTVRRVLRGSKSQAPPPSTEQAQILAHLEALYPRCKGNAVRIQELLQEEQGIEVPYSTLTRLIRVQALRAPKRRSGLYAFGPGEELQHDTSPHRLELGGKMLTAQCASLILAYSRLLFFQYYPSFTRFEAKAFLSEGLGVFDGSCPRCTIDNTSVILAGGSGPDALIAPEMEAFGALFGMRFIPHAIGHSDRKDWAAYCTSCGG
jgi:transposase